MKKKLIPIALALVGLLAVLGCTAPALMSSPDTGLTIQADDTEYSVGDTVTYTVTLGPVKDLRAMKFKLELPEGLTYVEGSGEEPEGLSEAMQAVKAEFTEQTKVYIFLGEVPYSSKKDTVLMTMQCEVNEKAPVDSTQTLRFIPEKLECFDEDGESIPCTLTDSKVKVIPRPPMPFTDVKEGDWFYKGVSYATRKGLFKGVSDTEFGPKLPMTRSMVVQVLYSMAGKPAVEKTSQFPDVKDPDWFSDAVAWAVKEGVSSGYADGRFGPNDVVTREQLAVMLHGYMGKPEATLEMNFADAKEISGWAEKALQWAVENKLMNGVGGNKVSPKTTATRAEGAVIMMQFDKLSKK